MSETTINNNGGWDGLWIGLSLCAIFGLGPCSGGEPTVTVEKIDNKTHYHLEYSEFKAP